MVQTTEFKGQAWVQHGHVWMQNYIIAERGKSCYRQESKKGKERERAQELRTKSNEAIYMYVRVLKMYTAVCMATIITVLHNQIHAHWSPTDLLPQPVPNNSDKAYILGQSSKGRGPLASRTRVCRLKASCFRCNKRELRRKESQLR